MWIVKPFTLYSTVFINFLSVLRQKSLQTMRFKKYNGVESDAYGFEFVLAFVAFHPWANSKWVIDQSEHVLFFCYAIKNIIYSLYSLSLCSLPERIQPFHAVNMGFLKVLSKHFNVIHSIPSCSSCLCIWLLKH